MMVLATCVVHLIDCKLCSAMNVSIHTMLIALLIVYNLHYLQPMKIRFQYSNSFPN